MLVVSIAAIPLVKALTLFGEEVSMLILMPLILIFIFLAAFIFMIVKDKIKARSITTPEPATLPEPDSAEALSELPLAKKEPLKEATIPKIAQQKPEPQIDYLQEAEALGRELPLISIEDANKKLNELIKRFFMKYAGINYSFTFEELKKELKKGNKKIQCFSDNLSSINYSPKGTSKEDLIELLKEFKDVVVSSKEESLLLMPEFKKEIRVEEKKINKLLKKGEKLIGKDTDKAKEKYNEISELYETLPYKEKKAIRSSIIDFYFKLNL